MMAVRGIRGATTADENTREAILEATNELLQEMVGKNCFLTEEIAACFFTTTIDLNAEFPAVAARKMGWEHVALLCSHEMSVPDSLKRCIRVLILLNTDKESDEMVNVYIKEARALRSRGMNGEQ